MDQRTWYLLLLGLSLGGLAVGVFTDRLLPLALLGAMLAAFVVLSVVTSGRNNARVRYGVGVSVVASLVGLGMISLGGVAIGVFLVLMALPGIAYTLYGPESAVLWGLYTGICLFTSALALFVSSSVVAVVFAVAAVLGARSTYENYDGAPAGFG